MIIWSGKGFLVFVIIFLDSLFAEMISESITHDENYYQKNLLPLGCSFLVSAILIRLIADFLARNAKKNMQPGDNVMLTQNRHALFFIPLIYWSLICLILGLGIIIYQLMKGV